MRTSQKTLGNLQDQPEDARINLLFNTANVRKTNYNETQSPSTLQTMILNVLNMYEDREE
jgi:hypothetical protein